MWLAFVMALAVSAEKNEAELLFQKMEAKLVAATTVSLSFDVKVEAAMNDRIKGSLAAGKGKLFRLELNGTKNDQGKPFKMLTVSDGAKMVTIIEGEPNKPKPQAPPKDIDVTLRRSLARAGIFITYLSRVPDVADPKELFRASDFKLGNKEKIGAHDTQRVDYRLAVMGQKPTFAAAVWIDLETGLPAKRTVTFEEGKEKFLISETYENLTVDGKVEMKIFQLP